MRWARNIGDYSEEGIERKTLHSNRNLLLILGVAVALGLLFNATNPTGIRLIPLSWTLTAPAPIDPYSALEEFESGVALFLDARPAEAFHDGHIQGALNIPAAVFDYVCDMKLSQVPSEREIIVYGRTFSRRYDEETALKLVLRGYQRVRVLEGGFYSWRQMGYPVERMERLP